MLDEGTLRLAPLGHAAVLRQRRLGGLQCLEAEGDLLALRPEIAEGIEQPTTMRDVEQGAIVMLAMDLGHEPADLAQQRDARRLVVDEGPAGAVPPLDLPQHDLAVGGNPLLVQHGEGLMAGRRVEGGGDHAPGGAVAHQACIAAAAKRQPQGIEQDRFSGAGFAGKHGQPVFERDIEFFDKHDVANRQRVEHAPLIAANSPCWRRGRRAARSERIDR